MSEDVPVALTIAGSDSGGGAGVQMDLKAFAALGVFGTCAITALTAQNTVGVRGAWEAPPEFVRAQIEAVLDDLPVGAAKTGMLSAAAVVETVVRVAEERDVSLSSLALEDFQAASQVFEANVKDVFDFEQSVARRKSPGGTAPEVVREQLRLARACLEG